MRYGRRARRSNAARSIAFVVVAGLSLAAAGYLLFFKPGADASDAPSGATPVTITMAGFSPNLIRGETGEALVVTLVNPDNSHHSDGGGWHNLVLEELGVNVRVAPESVTTFTLPAALPGEYRWYCDICCGGSANPNMWGTLVVGV
jgi:hypothetical protein